MGRNNDYIRQHTEKPGFVVVGYRWWFSQTAILPAAIYYPEYMTFVGVEKSASTLESDQKAAQQLGIDFDTLVVVSYIYIFRVNNGVKELAVYYRSMSPTELLLLAEK